MWHLPCAIINQYCRKSTLALEVLPVTGLHAAPRVSWGKSLTIFVVHAILACAFIQPFLKRISFRLIMKGKKYGKNNQELKEIINHFPLIFTSS